MGLRFAVAASPLQQLLHDLERIFVNDRLMGAFRKVHRFFTLVDDALFRDVVLTVGPLLEKVSGIGVITEQL